MTALEKEALKISKQRHPCGKCAYFGGIWCNMPHSDLLVSENKANYCAEGIYKWLVEQEIENYNRKVNRNE